MAWAIAEFGPFPIIGRPGDPGLEVIYAKSGPTAYVVRIVGADTKPISGFPVVFWWPDAPVLPDWAKGCGKTQGVIGYTNSDGNVGFGMGSGAWYQPSLGEIGPHCAWPVAPDAECVCGIGMVWATDHNHFDTTYVSRYGPSAVSEPQLGIDATPYEVIDGIPVYETGD